MTTIRCSRLPLAWNCPESQNVPDGTVVLNIGGEPAEAGNASHRYMSAHVRGTELNIPQLAAEHGCDPDELSMLCAQGRKLLSELGKYIKIDGTMKTEVPLRASIEDNIFLVGNADIAGRQGRTGLVVDYKSGRLDADHTHQLNGYGYCWMQHLGPEIEKVTVIVGMLRTGTWDVTHLTREQLISWSEELSRRIRNGRGNFNPGESCAYCQRRTNCPGRQALLRTITKDWSVEGAPIIDWTPETRAAMGPAIGTMYGRAKFVESVAEEFRAAVKADVLEHGPLPIGDGRQLAITETNKRVLDPAKARPILEKYLSADDIDSATKISMAACEQAAASGARKGMGAGIKREMAAALEAAGALSLTTIQSLRETKAPQEKAPCHP